MKAACVFILALLAPIGLMAAEPGNAPPPSAPAPAATGTPDGPALPVIHPYRDIGQPMPDLIVSHKDPARRVNLQNLRGSVVVMFIYNFTGIPYAGVPNDPHC